MDPKPQSLKLDETTEQEPNPRRRPYGTPKLIDCGKAAAVTGSNSVPCWIAEAIYGTDDLRTRLLRGWLNGPYQETHLGRPVMFLYWKIGRQVAWLARRSAFLRSALKPLFEQALVKAKASLW